MKHASVCGLVCGCAILLMASSGCTREEAPVQLGPATLSATTGSTSHAVSTTGGVTTTEKTKVATTRVPILTTTRSKTKAGTTYRPTKAPARPVTTVKPTTATTKSATPTVPAAGNLKGDVYTAADGSYRIQVPAGDWTLQETGPLVIFMPSDQAGGLSFNIIVNEPMHGLDQLESTQLPEEAGPADDLQVFEKTTVDGRPAIHMVYMLEINGMDLHYVQYLIDGPEHGYILTYCGLDAQEVSALAASAQTFHVL